jgi:hypothetical protein
MKDGKIVVAMLGHQVRNEGRKRADTMLLPSRKDDFLKKSKPAREERRK